MTFLLNLESYLSLLRNEERWQVTKSCAITDKAKKAFANFCLKKGTRFALLRILAIKKVVRQASKVGLIKPIKVKTHYFKSGHIYMLDKGEIHINRDFIFSEHYEKNVVSVIHELAHVYFSQQPYYKQLLEFDLSFANEYLTSPSQTVIAPIEFYANVLTCDWIMQVMSELPKNERVEKIIEEVELIKEKMLSSISKLRE